MRKKEKKEEKKEGLEVSNWCANAFFNLLGQEELLVSLDVMLVLWLYGRSYIWELGRDADSHAEDFSMPWCEKRSG